MDDLISRQAAIDALKEKVFHNLTDEFYGAMQVLDELPSAQPEYTEQDMRGVFSAGYDCGMEAARHEIIRCKDCKWHSGKYYCLNTDTYGFDGNDFCSAAERREE